MPPWLVEVFADDRHGGNAAGVVLNDGGFDQTEELQAIAVRLALPTTAFLAPDGPRQFRIRWFTPGGELQICGHATIASAAFLYEVAGFGPGRLSFRSRTDLLHTETCSVVGGGLLVSIDLPRLDLAPCDPPPGLAAALGAPLVSCASSTTMVLAELSSDLDVARLCPDFTRLRDFSYRGQVVTAAGSNWPADFVSRAFFPSLGVDEDQVCVSAHRFLGPFWSARLGRPRLSALQLSERGGRLAVETAPGRVQVAGSAVVRGPVAAGAAARSERA